MGDFISTLLHPADIIKSAGQIGGYILISAIIFAESGLLIGFFLPGDSLLFTVGFLASQGFLDIQVVSVLCFVAAITGDSVGYAFGHRVGRQLFQRPDSRLFKQEYLLRAENFYEKHGAKTIVLARFVPVVRTFAPIVAGIGKMTYRTFLTYNVIGGALWALGLTWLGYWIGDLVPNVDRFILPVIAIIILLSILPGIIELLKTPERRKTVLGTIRGFLSRRK